jgi:hypothetical protein
MAISTGPADERPASSSPFSRAAELLEVAAVRLVECAALAATDTEDEDQRREGKAELSDEALSTTGRALSDAARGFALAAEAFDRCEWPATAEALADVATSLGCAATSLGPAHGGEGLRDAADALQDASTVTGCMMLAAAAGPSLQSSADGLATAAIGLRGAKPAAGVQAAGALRLVCEAADALERVARSMRVAGEQLEAGRVGRD